MRAVRGAVAAGGGGGSGRLPAGVGAGVGVFVVGTVVWVVGRADGPGCCGICCCSGGGCVIFFSSDAGAVGRTNETASSGVFDNGPRRRICGAFGRCVSECVSE